MASKEDKDGCVTLTWEIQNFSLLLSLDEEKLFTPFWKAEQRGNCEWRRLRIYLTDSYIHFDVISVAECLQLDRCEVSLISSCMEIKLELCCDNPDEWCYAVKRDVVAVEKRPSILPNDTLTLRCKMWEKTIRTREFRISTVLHSFSCLWNIENFSPHDFYSKYIPEEGFLFEACLTSKSKKGTHTFILDEVSTIERCVSPIFCKLSDKIGVLHVIKEIFKRKSNNKMYEIKICLNNQRLDLQLESVFAVHKVCQNPFKLPPPSRYKNVSKVVSGAPRDDLLLLYRDKLFSDATLNAEGKPFYVHRNILSARSPVFRAMFEKDEMSEGQSGVVDIDDVDSETVDRMLVYLYGDSLEGVQQWEEVSSLYYAADKYDIQPLKHKCASSLKEGLTIVNACEALLLAHRHSDNQLMKCIVDFIRQNEEVMSSKKWDSFENSNPLLSSKILREIYVKNRKI